MPGSATPVQGECVEAGSLSFWLSAVYGSGSSGVSLASGAGQRPALPGKPRRFLAPTGELNSPDTSCSILPSAYAMMESYRRTQVQRKAGGRRGGLCRG